MSDPDAFSPPGPGLAAAPGGGSGPDWDARYLAAEGGLFGETPNLWLRMALARPSPVSAPASALLIADGDGRNSAWLARQGPVVTAFDLAPEAVRRAEARDRAVGVEAERFAADLTAWSPGARRWDLVALIHLQGPELLRRAAFAASAAALAPGGRLVLEGFGGEGGGPGPERSAQRWQDVEVEAWTAAEGLVAEELLEGLVTLDEGPRHQGPARMLRLIARRPA